MNPFAVFTAFFEEGRTRNVLPLFAESLVSLMAKAAFRDSAISNDDVLAFRFVHGQHIANQAPLSLCLFDSGCAELLAE
ncbi:hypothetical protein IRJ34_18300 [Paenarthrobacter sp. GOM3]|uniref:hypothetical protein n=1 Tax=Paenarthrobacter sp. GOM3 TaxID=2782567 RepID=UPI001BA44F3E|nr:hypothetical protein [Paenarthrobacter sp. GOM3]WOH18284.1 hypothetical protein IRJ34_18300 [Paenarthrobacter sp. GOM3]